MFSVDSYIIMLNLVGLGFTEPGGGSKLPFLLLLKMNPVSPAEQGLIRFL